MRNISTTPVPVWKQLWCRFNSKPDRVTSAATCGAAPPVLAPSGRGTTSITASQADSLRAAPSPQMARTGKPGKPWWRGAHCPVSALPTAGAASPSPVDTGTHGQSETWARRGTGVAGTPARRPEPSCSGRASAAGGASEAVGRAALLSRGLPCAAVRPG